MTTVLERDIVDALTRLRQARTLRNNHEIRALEKRLDWLLEKVKR